MNRSKLDFSGKRVTVVGLGIEGVDLVRYLAGLGARVTVSDAKPAVKLADRIERINGIPVRLSLGANDPQDLEGADALFLSQGVPLDLAGLASARARGVPIYSMLSLFMELCPGPIAGITGSSGKTTTTALIGEMFRAAERPAFVGGNIGVGLLERLPEITPETWSILEISHTQLQLLARSPRVAAILNVTPNHLDRFSWEEYRSLKAHILRFQGTQDVAVLGFDDPEARGMDSSIKGRRLWFSLGEELPGEGVFVQEGWATLQRQAGVERLFPLASLRLIGRHNQANALAAAAIAAASGLPAGPMAKAVKSFRGVPHRLEFVAEFGGVDYYNDSIATTPERTLAGIRSFQRPLVLLLGGRDKHLPLEGLASEADRRCRAVVLFGESAEKLEQAFRSRSGNPSTLLARVSNLTDAAQEARRLAEPGDVVLLSPACASFDAYDNFERRGEHFRRIVQEMKEEEAASSRR